MLGARNRSLASGAALALVILGSSHVWATEVRWQAPEACQRAEAVSTSVENLVGRPLSAVESPRFEVTISEQKGRWKLDLVTLDGGATPSRRTIRGQSCEEVSDAAGVAMAMTIRANDDEASEGSGADTRSEPEPSASPPAVVARPAPKPPRSPASEPSPTSFGAVFGVSAGLDVGALPGPSPGVVVSAGATVSALRVEAQGTVLLPSTAGLTATQRADFGFLAAALLACLAEDLSGFGVHGCAGFELGRIAGEGRGVTDPTVGEALWQAARLEVGAVWPMKTGLRLIGRVGVSIPTDRPQFQLDGTDIHRSGTLTLRAALGGEFAL